MKPDVKSWEASSHSNVTCYGCHGAQTIPSLLVHKVKALNELRLHVTKGFEQPINISSELSENEAEMANSICNRCHSVTQRNVTPNKGIIINHKAHEKEGLLCTRCHNRVAHLTADKYIDTEVRKENPEKYKNRMEMRYCMECHTGKEGKGPKECSTCHPKGFELKPDSHLKDDFFPKKHGKIALQDTEYCKSCHFEAKLCVDCHKTEIPHPTTGWVKKVKDTKHHSVDGKADPKSCQLCHKGANFCDACHHNNKTGKTWISVHFNVVKKQGAATPCFKCHSALMCAHCHVSGKKD